MSWLYGGANVGRKNVVFGIGLFLLLGLLIGIPLTIDLFGGSTLTAAQYQTWKVIHGYGVFLAFINYFFGLSLDRLPLPRREKELASWSFIAAGVVGGLVRMTLVLFDALGDFGLYASLAETVFVVLGTAVFMRGQVRAAHGRRPERPGEVHISPAR
jgi:hypothetical protein